MMQTMRRPLAIAAALGLVLSAYVRAQDDTTAKCPENYSACPGIGLPFLMCCPYESQCIGLAGNTTKLCCTTDQQGCVDIAPVTCDMRAQNSTRARTSLLSTALLAGDDAMATCMGGPNDSQSLCCPFGYLCDPGTGNRCRKLLDQDNWREGGALAVSPLANDTAASAYPTISRTSSTTSTTLSPSSSETEGVSSSTATTSVPGTTGTEDPALAPTTSAPNTTGTEVPAHAPTTSAPKTTGTEAPALAQTTLDEAPKFPATAVLVGFFPGIAAGVIFCLVWLCCWGSYLRNHRKDEQDGRSRTAKETISGPFGTNARSDFGSAWSPTQESTPGNSDMPPMGKVERVKSGIMRSSASMKAAGSQAVRGLGIRYHGKGSGVPSHPPLPTPTPAPAPLSYRAPGWQQGNAPMRQIAEDVYSPMSPLNGEIPIGMEAPRGALGMLSIPHPRPAPQTVTSIYSTDGFGTRASAAPMPQISQRPGNRNRLSSTTEFSQHPPFSDGRVDQPAEFVTQWGTKPREGQVEERNERQPTRVASGPILAPTAYTPPPSMASSSNPSSSRRLYPK